MTIGHDAPSPMSDSTTTRSESLADLAGLVQGDIIGDPTTMITGVCDLRHGHPTGIGYVNNSRYSRLLNSTAAGAVLVDHPYEGVSTAQVVVDEPQLRFARLAQHFHPRVVANEHEVHETAVVHARAQIETPARIGPHTSVGAGTSIGRGTILHAGVVIGERVTIGRECILHPRVTIYDDVTLGDGVTIHAGAVLGADGFGYVADANGARVKFPQMGTLIIGDGVEIGANTTLDRAALTANRIGPGTKIDNLCHIGHNCTIGSDSAIAALSGFAADTHLGDRVTIAGHVVSSGDVHVADNVVIGGNSVLTFDVRESGEYAGYPLQPRATSARNIVMRGRLVELREEMKRIRREMNGRSHE